MYYVYHISGHLYEVSGAGKEGIEIMYIETSLPSDPLDQYCRRYSFVCTYWCNIYPMPRRSDTSATSLLSYLVTARDSFLKTFRRFLILDSLTTYVPLTCMCINACACSSLHVVSDILERD